MGISDLDKAIKNAVSGKSGTSGKSSTSGGTGNKKTTTKPAASKQSAPGVISALDSAIRGAVEKT